MNNGFGYVPENPYVIQSGKRAGKCLELLMFEDYSFISWQRKRCDEGCTNPAKMNKLHKHLVWLMTQGNMRKSKRICPQCGKNPITHFSVMRSKYGVSVSTNYVCCDNDNCKEKLKGLAFEKTPDILPFKFWVLNYFSSKTDQKMISNLFRKVLGLEERLTREKAFEFFKR